MIWGRMIMIDHAPYLPSFGHYSRFSSSHGAETQANGYGLAAYHLGLSGQDHLADHSGGAQHGEETSTGTPRYV